MRLAWLRFVVHGTLVPSWITQLQSLSASALADLRRRESRLH